VGKKYPLKIIRGAKELTLEVKITKKPQDLEPEESVALGKSKAMFRGMAIDDITPLYQKQFRISDAAGVVVTYIEEGSPAEKSGIMISDVIVKVDGKNIKSKEDFIATVSKIKGSWLLKTNKGFFVVKEK
jgi:S1-C subfamily serine protease